MRSPARRLMAAAAIVLALAGRAGAGQVFVSVGSPQFAFAPTNAGVAGVGDFVIWTWFSNAHTVTSGTTGSTAGDLNFNSNPLGGSFNTGTVFAWKTSGGGVFPYYSRPDFVTRMMKGSIVVPDATPVVADFRITEVRFDGAGSDFVEIANLGADPGDLNAFRLSIGGAAPLTPWTASTPLASGARVVVNNPPGLSDQGSVALFAPFLAGSVPGTAALTDTTMIVDYVEWGASGGQPLEDTAIHVHLPATLWLAGEFAPQVAAGHSIVFCGNAANHGGVYWQGSLNPTPGLMNDCASAARRASWGRLKTLYR